MSGHGESVLRRWFGEEGRIECEGKNIAQEKVWDQSRRKPMGLVLWLADVGYWAGGSYRYIQSDRLRGPKYEGTMWTSDACSRTHSCAGNGMSHVE